jgi:hypothetical protein
VNRGHAPYGHEPEDDDGFPDPGAQEEPAEALGKKRRCVEEPITAYFRRSWCSSRAHTWSDVLLVDIEHVAEVAAKGTVANPGQGFLKPAEDQGSTAIEQFDALAGGIQGPGLPLDRTCLQIRRSAEASDVAAQHRAKTRFILGDTA